MSRAPIAATATIAAADGVLSTTFGDEVVLLNPADGVYFGLRDAGARAWSLIERSTSLASMRDAIVAEYDVDGRTCERDLAAFVGELLRRGLVTVRP